MKTFLAERGYSNANTPPQIRHAAVRSLGYHALAADGEITAITPTALCAAGLLAAGTRGVERPLLKHTIDIIANVAKTANARFASGIFEKGQLLLDECIERGITFLVREQAVRVMGTGDSRVYVSEEDSRIRLDFYKNQLIQHLLDVGLLAAGLRASCQPLRSGISSPNTSQEKLFCVPLEKRRSVGNFVGGLVRLHIVAHAGESISSIVDNALARLESLKIIQIDQKKELIIFHSDALEKFKILYGLVESILENQNAVTKALTVLREGPRLQKEMETEILEQLHRQYLTNSLRRYESCQVSLVKSSIEWLCDEGILVQQGSPDELELALTRQHLDGQALDILVERIEPLLNRRVN